MNKSVSYTRFSLICLANRRISQGFLFSINQVVSLCRPCRLARPRTPPFHGENTGSNPVGATNTKEAAIPLNSRFFVFVIFRIRTELLRRRKRKKQKSVASEEKFALYQSTTFWTRDDF